MELIWFKDQVQDTNHQPAMVRNRRPAEMRFFYSPLPKPPSF